MVRLLKLLSLFVLFFAGITLGFFLILRYFSSTSTILAPGVEGFSVEEARFIAGREHLELEVREEKYDTRREAGVVVKQAPSAGMPVRKGQAIYVTVSKGIERTVAPDLTGMPLDRAQIEIQQNSLKFKGVTYISSREPSQTVLSQSPAPGAIASRDAECYLLVSQGGKRPLFSMPDLRGKGARAGESALSEYGIAAGVEKRGGDEGDVIISQRPLPGYPVSALETVSLGAGK